MRSNIFAKIITSVFVLTAIFWLTLFILGQYSVVNDESLKELQKFTQIPLVIIPLLGGLFGLNNALHWGGARSVLGKAVLGISLGLLAWSGGMIIWNYYLFFTDIEVPYPSLADVIFILSWPLWTYGLLKLSKAIGSQFGWRTLSNKVPLFIGSGIIILFSIYLIFGVARGWSVSFQEIDWKLFFDLFYPIGSIVISTLVLLLYWLSKQFLGGVYKNTIFVLFLGFVFNYIADFTFSLTTTNETYFNGHFVDFMFAIAMFTLSLGVSLFNSNVLNKNTE